MSRSYRKPYCTYSRITSAGWAKRLASRLARRRNNNLLRSATDFENYLDPDRREARFNNVYCWPQDGHLKLTYELRFPGRLHYWERDSWYSDHPERVERAIARHEKWMRKITRK